MNNMRHKKPLLVLLIMATVFFICNTTESPAITEGDPQKALEAFATISKVLRSPRCINCHPSDNVPRVGDDSHEHLFGVVRGAADHNGPVQKCATCHQNENNAYTRIPGAPHWGLAPIGMGWQGLSDAQLGQTLLDTSRNGNRSPEALVEHMSHDALVLWAWDPGEGRTPPPVPLDEFRAALQTWLENGATVPE